MELTTLPRAVRPLPARGDRLTLVALLAVAAGAWVVTAIRMSGMDAGPGTNPGSLGFYISTWVVMMVAMMLPATAPATRGYRDPGATASFICGYLLVWAAAGLLAYVVLEAGRSVAGGAFAWDRAGRWTAAGVLAFAAAYELTPLKRACLARCRRDTFFGCARGDRGLARPVLAGVDHGAWCIGCCWALMAALFALGAMSLVWMALLAVVITCQKLLPRPAPTVVAASLVLAALAVGVAVAPGSVPGLTLPGGTAAMHAMHAMGMGR